MKRMIGAFLAGFLVISFVMAGSADSRKAAASDKNDVAGRISALEKELALLKAMIQDDEPVLKIKGMPETPDRKTGARVFLDGTRGWEEDGTNMWTSVGALPNYNVGIGTNTPWVKLEVAGHIRANRGALTNVEVFADCSNNPAWDYAGIALSNGTYFPATRLQTFGPSHSPAHEFHIRHYPNAPVIISTFNAERMRIAGNGNVGIGNPNPSYRLDVTGDFRVTGGINDGASFGLDDYVLVADGLGGVAWEPSPAGGAGDYIWNQFAAAQTPGDFWIDGTGRAGVTTGKYAEINHASYGVYGQYNASNYGYIGASGYGVYGRGTSYGVYGYGTYGVRGYGTTYGVWGYYNSSNYGHVGRSGYGVYGRGSTYGVYGYGSSYGVYGYYSSTIYGYIANSANGVYGVSNSSTGEAAGVYGQGTHDNSVTSAKGMRATATVAPNTYVSIGISSVAGADGPGGWFWGNNKSSGSWWGASGAGLVGWGRYGLVGVTNDVGYGGVFGQATEDGSAGVWGLSDYAEAYLAYYDGILDYGLLVVSGAKSCAMSTSKGHKALFSVESPEVLFVDYGSGKLHNGRANVELEDTFLEVVAIDESHPYRVVVTPTGACNGVYVIKEEDSFEVVELGNPTSNATFDYQIIAHRKGYEDNRFPEVKLMDRGQKKTIATNEAIRNQ